MTDISIENYSLSAGSKKLLTDTKLVVSMNTRYGLVGPNGCGKSTLLNDINKHKDSLLVKQEVIASETSVEDEVASVNPILLKMIWSSEEEQRKFQQYDVCKARRYDHEILERRNTNTKQDNASFKPVDYK